MSRTAKLLGTVSVVATLAAGPASADTLMGFAGMFDAAYSNTSLDDDEDFFGTTNADDSISTFSFGAAIAFPIDEIAGFNWELNAAYGTSSGDEFSFITWDFGGSLFWAGPGSRFWANIQYNTLTDFGSLTNGGIFAEWYLGNFTIQGKGGFLWGSGTPNGGRGNYLGGAVTGYFVPNFAITGAVAWADLITGASQGFACFGPTCGRRNVIHTDFSLQGEFLVSDAFPVSIYGGYTFTDASVSENVSNPLTPEVEFNTNTFFIGVRYYMGGMGTLIDHHRNGNLHSFLRGPRGLGATGGISQ